MTDTEGGRGTTPAHVQVVLDRYGVTTRAALNRAVREDYRAHTGTRFSVAAADALIDQMMEAEYQRQESGGDR